jgi:hypothetical protein
MEDRRPERFGKFAAFFRRVRAVLERRSLAAFIFIPSCFPAGCRYAQILPVPQPGPQVSHDAYACMSRTPSGYTIMPVPAPS